MEDKVGRPQEPPLESWKEIAAYVKRDIRTVIRWEKSEGLPVHRQMHQARGSVFAYPSELAAWKASRALKLVAGPRPEVWRRAAEVAGLVVAVLLALGTAGGGPFFAPLRAASGDGDQGMVLRQIRFPGLEETPYAQISPDGQRVLYVRPAGAGGPADLTVRDLSSGSEETVVGAFGDGGFSLFRWSPDGARVVYTHQRRGLRVVGSRGGGPRLLWSSPDPGAVVKPLDWARDGRSILAALVDETARTTRLVLVPAEGGEPRVVVSGNRGELEDWALLSPDGRFVAGVRSEGGASHVCVWASDGDQETRVTEPAARVSPAFWSPDGAYLVFTSDQMNTQDLWAVPMRDGRPRGTPLRIKQDLGRNAMLTGFTSAGQLTMIVTGEGTRPDLFVQDVDRSSGEPRGEFTAYAAYPTDHFLPRWSPDGSRLAYTSRKGQVRKPALFVSSPDGRSEEEILASDYYVGNVAWSPDGASVLFPGFLPPDGQAGIFQVGLDSHRVTPLHLGERLGPQHQGAFVNLQWLPLAKRLMFAKLAGTANSEIYTMEGDGRQVERVAEVPTSFWVWPSPDGRHIAYRQGQELKLLTRADQASVTLATFSEGTDLSGPAWSPDARGIAFSDTRRLQVLSPAGGAPRTLVEAPAGSAIGGTSWLSGVAWSPEGRLIAYLQRETPAKAGSRSELWLVPAAGGTPRRAAVALASHPLLTDLAWHPGGTKICATGGAGEGPVRASYQHWVMEGFLPAR
jgi:Tol biopolymer transport system component